MSNTSATGGYLLPTATQPIPGGLTLAQFLQTVLVGISGLDGKLVRPSWQIAPPKNPDLSVNWLAFGDLLHSPDANAYVGVDADDATIMQRHEGIEIPCSFYGPEAMEYAALVRDGFQLSQNTEALRAAKMGFVEVNQARRMPDLVNERWINKVVMSVFLRREIIRVYPILPILSANGTVHTVIGDEPYLFDWETKTP